MMFSIRITQEAIEAMIAGLKMIGAEFIPWFLKVYDETGRAPSKETIKKKFLRIKTSADYDSHYPKRKKK